MLWLEDKTGFPLSDDTQRQPESKNNRTPGESRECHVSINILTLWSSAVCTLTHTHTHLWVTTWHQCAAPHCEPSSHVAASICYPKTSTCEVSWQRKSEWRMLSALSQASTLTVNTNIDMKYRRTQRGAGSAVKGECHLDPLLHRWWQTKIKSIIFSTFDNLTSPLPRFKIHRTSRWNPPSLKKCSRRKMTHRPRKENFNIFVCVCVSLFC